MMPFINDGDIVSITSLSERPNRGDVVAFTSPNGDKLMIHRIISIKPEGFLLKGDNISTPDGFAKSDDIIGKIIRVERNGGTVPLGLGAERHLIPVITGKHRRLLYALILPLWKIMKPIIKKLRT